MIPADFPSIDLDTGKVYRIGKLGTAVSDTATGGSTPIAKTGHTCDGGLAFLNGKLFFTSHEMLASVDPNKNGSYS